MKEDGHGYKLFFGEIECTARSPEFRMEADNMMREIAEKALTT